MMSTVNEDIKDTFKKVKRCTIYTAVKECINDFRLVMDLSSIEYITNLSNNKTITWRILYETLSKFEENNKKFENIKYLINLFKKRASREREASKYFTYFIGNNIEHCMKLYYEFENKNLNNIVSYIDAHYQYNIDRLTTKYHDLCSNSKINSNIYKYYIVLTKYLESGIMPKKYTFSNKEIRKFILTDIKSLDILLEHIKLLKQNNSSDIDIDSLYSVILFLKNDGNKNFITNLQDKKKLSLYQITKCAVCWRPALVRFESSHHSTYCHAHFYDGIFGIPPHKHAYERALKVSQSLKYDYYERMNLIKKIFDKLVNTEVGRGSLLMSWNWWQEQCPTGEISMYVLEVIPNVSNFLKKCNADPKSKESIIKTLFPMPLNANPKECQEYEKLIAGWLQDFRYFIPVLADAELWLKTFANLFPKLDVDC